MIVIENFTGFQMDWTQVVAALLGGGVLGAVLTFFSTNRKTDVDLELGKHESFRKDFEIIVKSLQDDNESLRRHIADLTEEISHLKLEREKLTEEVNELRRMIQMLGNVQ